MLSKEGYLVNYIEYCQKRGFPLTRKMVKMFARETNLRNGIKIAENGPSSKWFRSFLKGHPKISMTKPRVIDGGKTKMSNQTVVKQHFDLLQETINAHDFHNKPQCVYNMDEIGFGQGAILDKVCAVNRQQSYTKMATTSSHVTAAVCISADGRVLPTFVIYEKSFPCGAYRDGIPEDWLFGVSNNGYMDADLFLKWFKQVFLKNDHCSSN